jgi:RNA polymerase sigma-70 factor, ECF subfamily
MSGDRTERGAEQPFKQAMLAALPSLRAFAMSLAGRPDRADDLVQETVMKAWAKQSSFQLGTNMNAWLFTILRNLFYSQMRKRGREVQDSDGLFTASLGVAPSQDGVMDLAGFPPGAAEPAARPARGGAADRRLGLLLRGGR